MTINFPWGSLLDGLLAGDPGLAGGLESVSRPGAQIESCLNSGALRKAGTNLEAGAAAIHGNLVRNGWRLQCPRPMERGTLAKFPTTWARRLAFGRDPLAVSVIGRRAQE